MINRKCIYCNLEFNVLTNSNPKKFCNNSCSALYNNKIRPPRSIESRLKSSISAKLNPSGFVIDTTKRSKGFLSAGYIKNNKLLYSYTKIISITCEVCQTIKYVKGRNKIKTCSKNCTRILTSKNISKSKKGKPGIIRNRAGRGKSGLYKGFWLSSTYELAYLIYCLDHDIHIERNNKGFPYFNPDTNSWHKFYPDFIVDGKLTEIKGYKSKITEYKLSGVTEPIQILYQEELTHIFHYVEHKTKIKIKDIYNLYEAR